VKLEEKIENKKKKSVSSKNAESSQVTVVASSSEIGSDVESKIQL
jgi:hypothetical protein